VSEPTTPEESAPGEGVDVVVETPPTELFGCPVTVARGQTVVHPTRDGYLAAVKALTDDGYTTCVDLTAVDYVAHPGRVLPDGIVPERFEVAAVFLDIAAARRLRLRVQVPESDPTLPTLFDVHPGTEAMEREVFDMFGITFDDHPDMTRILMPEDWEGHPLRKDYEIGAIPVQFKAAPS
jgi:NADH-quinone oxidoreductase subunit C